MRRRTDDPAGYDLWCATRHIVIANDPEHPGYALVLGHVIVDRGIPRGLTVAEKLARERWGDAPGLFVSNGELCYPGDQMLTDPNMPHATREETS